MKRLLLQGLPTLSLILFTSLGNVTAQADRPIVVTHQGSDWYLVPRALAVDAWFTWDRLLPALDSLRAVSEDQAEALRDISRNLESQILTFRQANENVIRQNALLEESLVISQAAATSYRRRYKRLKWANRGVLGTLVGGAAYFLLLK